MTIVLDMPSRQSDGAKAERFVTSVAVSAEVRARVLAKAAVSDAKLLAWPASPDRNNHGRATVGGDCDPISPHLETPRGIC